MARESRGVVKINLFMGTDVLAVLRRMAAMRGCAYSELVREACHQYVLKEGPAMLKQHQAIRGMAK